jgi:hypothetical protein
MMRVGSFKHKVKDACAPLSNVSAGMQDTSGHSSTFKVLRVASDPHLLWAVLCKFESRSWHSFSCHLCHHREYHLIRFGQVV